MEQSSGRSDTTIRCAFAVMRRAVLMAYLNTHTSREIDERGRHENRVVCTQYLYNTHTTRTLTHTKYVHAYNYETIKRAESAAQKSSSDDAQRWRRCDCMCDDLCEQVRPEASDACHLLRGQGWMVASVMWKIGAVEWWTLGFSMNVCFNSKRNHIFPTLFFNTFT